MQIILSQPETQNVWMIFWRNRSSIYTTVEMGSFSWIELWQTSVLIVFLTDGWRVMTDWPTGLLWFPYMLCLSVFFIVLGNKNIKLWFWNEPELSIRSLIKPLVEILMFMFGSDDMCVCDVCLFILELSWWLTLDMLCYKSSFIWRWALLFYSSESHMCTDARAQTTVCYPKVQASP